MIQLVHGENMTDLNYKIVNIEKLLNNIKLIKQEYSYEHYILDVSNDAFYHGMELISYLDDEFHYLYVHSLFDVLKIRKYNKDISIIFNGLITENNLFDLIVNNTIIVIHDLKTIEEIISFKIKDKLEIILHIDPLGYHGFAKKEDILYVLEEIKKNTHLKIIGIESFVSLSTYEEFKHIISPLKDLKLKILNHEQDKNKIKGSNAIRLIDSVYGTIKNKKVFFKKEEIKYQPIMSIRSTIINIKRELKHKKEIYTGVIPFGTINGMNVQANNARIKDKSYSIKEIFEDYSLIEIDESININDTVEILIENSFSLSNIPTSYEINNSVKQI